MKQVRSNTTDQGILWLVLNEASQQLLQRTLPPRYNNTFYHHVTLLFGVAEQEVARFIGQQHTITGYAHAYNNEAQALRVRTSNLPDMYGVPHITLSTAEGVEPFASVAMLRGDHIEHTLESSLALTGVIVYEPLKK